jgi:hypothetical protein
MKLSIQQFRYSSDNLGYLVHGAKSAMAIDGGAVEDIHDYVEEYMEFAKRLEPDNPNIDPYLKKYDPNHVTASLADEIKVDPFLRFNDENIITILNNKGFPVKSELDRWRSLMSLM